MSWKKHFTKYDPGNTGSFGQKTNRWASWLPEVYSGQPNRVERYTQYDIMDQDSEINSALDTIAEFSTQSDPDTKLPFKIHYKEEATESEVNALETALKQWININDFDRRVHGLFRATIKYGDQFFIRDPETYKLFWVNVQDVSKVIINESSGKDIEQYLIKNISLNLHDMVVVDTKQTSDVSQSSTVLTSNKSNAGVIQTGAPGGGTTEYAVGASNVLHIALSDGLTNAWPFGNSILDSVFKSIQTKRIIRR